MKNALCLGSFDGIHNGHRNVLSVSPEYRRVVVTFKAPPKSVLSGEASMIMTLDQKCEALRRMGIKEIDVLDFLSVKDMSANEFLKMLLEKYNPGLISCGFNYRFGKGGEGDINLLRDFCDKNGINLRVCEPVKDNQTVISSTMVRGLLQNGEIEKANEFLYEPFSFITEVVKGDKRGRTIGFPTVNQKYPDQLVKLKFGVYKTKVEFDGESYIGITNIGIRPTFKSDYIISETYIKNFSGDLYGKILKITPIKFLREETKFSSLEELKRQIEIDLKK
ncbi:MAG: riboflavin biosynthesis protein RibF [Clostridia bacterium]|nr:riboflavin biosynthesis protein RibF [Clostridia bacterium]